MDDSEDESFDPARRTKHHDSSDDDDDDDLDNELDDEFSKPRSKSKGKSRSCPVTPKAAVSEPFCFSCTSIWLKFLSFVQEASQTSLIIIADISKSVFFINIIGSI